MRPPSPDRVKQAKQLENLLKLCTVFTFSLQKASRGEGLDFYIISKQFYQKVSKNIHFIEQNQVKLLKSLFYQNTLCLKEHYYAIIVIYSYKIKCLINILISTPFSVILRNGIYLYK